MKQAFRPFNFLKKSNILAAAVSAIFGLILFFLLYSELLNPHYDAWLLQPDEPDLTQTYVGWTMYRHAGWSFPVGVANNYGYPVGVPISFTDSIPLLAVPFKLLAGFLPQNFQYIGFWLLLCFILQAVFGFLLIKNFTKSQILSVLGSIIFLLSPIALFRLGGHFALGGQWLILAGLWLLLREHPAAQFWQWAVLFVVSLLVHPYLFFMNGFLMLADAVMLIKNKKINIRLVFPFLLFQTILVFLTAYALGLFAGGQLKENGFGDFSMNLNALINPLGWSRLLPDWPIAQYQSEGFNYLGLGVIFLLALSLIFAVKKKVLIESIKGYWPIILICLILTLLAVSNIVVFNSFELVNISLPQNLPYDFLGDIRSSGRLFWPVFYLLILLSFYVLKSVKFKWALAILLLAIFLQGYDLSEKLVQRGEVFKGKHWVNPIEVPAWRTAAKDYKHISFIPVLHQRNYMGFALFAAANGLTINNGYFARPIGNLDQIISREFDNAKKGGYDKDTIYILSNNVELLAANLDLKKHLLVNIDDTFILLPNYKENHAPEEYEKLEFKGSLIGL